MSVEDVGAGTVRHSSGGEVGGIDRTTLYYERGGRRVLLTVDRGAVYLITLPQVPRWSDGAPVEERELAELEVAVREACRHWGVEAVVCHIDPTAPRTGIDDVVRQVQLSRPAEQRDRPARPSG